MRPIDVKLRLSDAVRWSAMRNDRMFRSVSGPRSAIADRLSLPAAIRAADNAIAHVPAYRDLVGADERRAHRDRSEWFRSLPATDKRSYIDRYSLSDRCLDGRISLIGTQLDESSGSSGVPYTWVRSRTELREIHLTLSRMARHLFGEKLVTLNGFSMGAWATGTNASAALAHNGIVKSTGPDATKILSALQLLGPQFTFVITGYPPFLRDLLEAGDAAGFDWTPYRMFGVVGGEGMSEALRARLEQQFVAVYSAYGASDLDIGVACELPISVRIRQRAAENSALARALFGEDRRLPMVFQYNPLDYFIETSESHELVITVNRLCMLSPRIRYNIHDVGGTIGYERMRAICRDFGFDIAAPVDGCAPMRLPFLFVNGRSDATLSYMGANIYPEDVEQALFVDVAPSDVEHIGSFCLEIVEAADATPRPCVHVEADEPSDDALAGRLAARIRERLVANSADFRASAAEDPADGAVVVRLHAPATGPFEGNATRIKRRYLVDLAAGAEAS